MVLWGPLSHQLILPPRTSQFIYHDHLGAFSVLLTDSLRIDFIWIWPPKGLLTCCRLRAFRTCAHLRALWPTEGLSSHFCVPFYFWAQLRTRQPASHGQWGWCAHFKSVHPMQFIWTPIRGNSSHHNFCYTAHHSSVTTLYKSYLASIKKKLGLPKKPELYLCQKTPIINKMVVCLISYQYLNRPSL